jgi:hypothetical protein
MDRNRKRRRAWVNSNKTKGGREDLYIPNESKDPRPHFGEWGPKRDFRETDPRSRSRNLTFVHFSPS